MIQKIAEILAAWDNILVVSHASPDGDTLGSAAALLRGLLSQGRQAFMACADEIPEKFGYLFAGYEDRVFAGKEAEIPQVDHVVTVDAADIKLLGFIGKKYEGSIDLSIDHHRTHVDFAKIEYVDADSAANAEIIFELLRAMDVELDQGMIDALYTGITTDTGCFKYRSVTERTHIMAGELIKLGARAGDINQAMFETRSRAQIQAELEILSSLEYAFEGRCALIAITRDLMKRSGLKDDEVDSFVSIPREIEGVLVGVSLKEKADGGFKMSIRTNPPADASAIAVKMGGGGHTGAAGCSFRGSMEEGKAKILGKIQEYFEENPAEFGHIHQGGRPEERSADSSEPGSSKGQRTDVIETKNVKEKSKSRPGKSIKTGLKEAPLGDAL